MVVMLVMKHHRVVVDVVVIMWRAQIACRLAVRRVVRHTLVIVASGWHARWRCWLRATSPVYDVDDSASRSHCFVVCE